MKTLICYPAGKTDKTYNMPDDVTTVIGSALIGNTFLEELTLSEKLASIEVCGIQNLTKIKTVRIPASVKNIEFSNFTECQSLAAFEVAAGNTAYTSVDSVLFSKDMTTLKVYPPKKLTENYEIPAGVTTIDEYAFMNAEATTITVPNSVTNIGYNAFSECKNLTDITILNPACNIYDSDYTIYNGWDNNTFQIFFNGTIHGYDNSTAQNYADKYAYKFERISGSAPEPAARMGDLDGSGVVDILDVIKINKNVLGTDKLTEEQQKLADINQDGKVDSSDALLLLKLALGMPIK
jgi:hypothetical protein